MEWVELRSPSAAPASMPSRRRALSAADVLVQPLSPIETLWPSGIAVPATVASNSGVPGSGIARSSLRRKPKRPMATRR